MNKNLSNLSSFLKFTVDRHSKGASRKAEDAYTTGTHGPCSKLLEVVRVAFAFGIS